MILRSKDVIDALAPHYAGAIIGAAVAAASAAASAAAQARQQAAQRKAQANAAQQSRMGAAAGGPPPTNVANSILGQAGGLAGDPRIKDLIQGAVKPVSSSVDASLTQPNPPSLPQGQSLGSVMGPSLSQNVMGSSMGLQQALGSQPPDYFQWMQNNGGNFTGF